MHKISILKLAWLLLPAVAFLLCANTGGNTEIKKPGVVFYFETPDGKRVEGGHIYEGDTLVPVIENNTQATVYFNLAYLGITERAMFVPANGTVDVKKECRVNAGSTLRVKMNVIITPPFGKDVFLLFINNQPFDITQQYMPPAYATRNGSTGLDSTLAGTTDGSGGEWKFLVDLFKRNSAFSYRAVLCYSHPQAFKNELLQHQGVGSIKLSELPVLRVLSKVAKPEGPADTRIEIIALAAAKDGSAVKNVRVNGTPVTYNAEDKSFISTLKAEQTSGLIEIEVTDKDGVSTKEVIEVGK